MGRSELGTRLIFGPLMLAFVAAIYWIDSTVMDDRGMRGVLCAGVIGLLAVAGVWEFVAMFRKAGYAIAGGLVLTVTALVCASAFLFGWGSMDRELYPVVIGTFVVLFPIALTSLTKDKMAQGLELQGGTLLAFIMIAWPMYLAQGMCLRHLPSVLFVVLVCKLGDSGAYLFGISFGKRKLIPHISGGKTVEGALGGMFSSCLVSVLLEPVLLHPEVELGLGFAIAIGILLNLTTQTGDLIESLLKRRCGVKDSSNMLPAHGGVLDLVDSLLFSFPAFFLVLTLLT